MFWPHISVVNLYVDKKPEFSIIMRKLIIPHSLEKKIFNRFMQNIATEYEMLLKSPCQNSERES